MWPRRVPRPSADQRFRVGSVTKTFTATIVLSSSGGEAEPLEHARGPRARRYSEGRGNHDPTPAPHRSGLANITDYPKWLKRAERSPSTVPINSLASQAPSRCLHTRHPGALLEHELHRARSRIEKVTGRSYAEELEQRVLDPLGSRGRSCRRRGASRISKTAATTRTFPGRRARSSRTRTTSPASTPLSSPGDFSPAPPSRR